MEAICGGVVGGKLLKGQVSLAHALNFTGGGWLSIFIPGQDVEFGYDDPDPFRSNTFTLPDQWETLYIHRGGPNANFDPRCPPGMICPESATEMTIGEAIKEGKVQGSWQWSKEERQKVIDCLTPITDEYISQVQNLNASASKGWNFNVSQYVASTLGLPASIDVLRGALREPGASVIYGWRKITINGARINPLSIPGGRRAFWINFTFASAVFLYTQLDANEKDGKTFGSRAINTPTPPPMVVATTGYQVWSSVLGTSLTSVNTSGEKVETKVFAGGTHIATQHEMNPGTTSDDSLIFVTADPVTGSVARYSGSGASADIEESEPLGQMIETSDPGAGYPTSYEDVRGIARDPEWQCQAAGLKRSTFNEMPVHCKKAKLAERDFYLPGALAESDPKRVAMPPDGHGSPGRGTPPTLKTGQSLAPEHLAQMRALAATGKFDNEEDNPACGLTDCVVNVEAQSDLLDALDASSSGPNNDSEIVVRKRPQGSPSDSCSIRLVYEPGQTMNNVTSTIPPRNLTGPVPRRNHEGWLIGATYNFQVEATVSGDPNEWEIVQKVYIRSRVLGRDGRTLSSTDLLKESDFPRVKSNIFRGQVEGRNLINWADSPGLVSDDPTEVLDTGYWAINGISTVRRGREFCNVRWSIVQTYERNQVTQKFNSGRFVVESDYGN